MPSVAITAKLLIKKPDQLPGLERLSPENPQQALFSSIKGNYLALSSAFTLFTCTSSFSIIAPSLEQRCFYLRDAKDQGRQGKPALAEALHRPTGRWL